jgi:type IV secretion system protein VirB9
MKYFSIACFSALLISTSSFASNENQTQIRSVIANNKTPISIDMVRGQPLMIEFDSAEIVNDIAFSGVGKWKDSWEIVKRGSRIFIKMIGRNDVERSLLVTTSIHSYVFYLQPHDTKKSLSYVSKLMVSFEKPTFSLPANSFAHAKQLQDMEDKVKEITLREPVISKRNYSYSMQIVSEGVDIRPRAAWDDGRFTYLTFPNNIAIPAVYRTIPNSDEESLVNWHVDPTDGDVLVLHGTSPSWTLRMGKSVVGVFNDNYDPVGISTPNKTTTSAYREIK